MVRRSSGGFSWKWWIIWICVSSGVQAYWPPLQQVEAELTFTHPSQWQVSFRVFDPLRKAWQAGASGVFEASQVYMRTNAGIVLWVAETAGSPVSVEGRFSVYDPAMGQWCTTNGPPLAEAYGMSTWDGVVSWWERYGESVDSIYLGASVYDPIRHQWISHKAGPFSGIGLSQFTFGGLATFRRVTQRGPRGETWVAHGWIYDPLRGEWKTGEFGPFTSGTWCMGVTGGSLTLCAGAGRYGFGYDYETGAWSEGVTRPLACFIAAPEEGFAPVGVWFTDLSLGATNWLWNFGDDVSNATNRSPWHMFAAPGSPTVTLQIAGLNAVASTYQQFLWRQRPQLLSVTVTNQSGLLEMVAEPGSIHVLQMSHDLSGWEDGSKVTNEEGHLLIWDPLPEGISRRFYRVRQEWPLLP